jgi:multiple sugar transport system ATP-binding protein
MAKVTVEEICKQFGEVGALDEVSCSFDDGELTVLVGPSGCGKTTLLRTIAGLEEPTAGTIYIGEEDVSGDPAWERNIAMVFQSYALYPHMTVFKNMAFPLEAVKASKNEIRKRVHETARILQIEELLERRPRELSGGQMQRVALGRAIIREPDVFLMDEPLSNLDARLRVLMRAELKHLQSQLGVTTIYVTHDQAEAMTLADKLIVMNNGRIQQVGRPEEVYRFPRNQFVAGFIGSPPMNFLEGRFEPTRNLLVGGGFEYPLGNRWTAILTTRQHGDLTLGVRPEDMTVDTSPSPGALRATVYVMEQLGREILLNVRIGEEIVRVFAAADAELEADQPVWLHFKQGAVHLFDRETEAALAWQEASTVGP